MSLENAHKLIRIYMGSLIVGVNTLYTLSCFLKQFALVGKGLTTDSYSDIETGVFFISAIPLSTPLSCCSDPFQILVGETFHPLVLFQVLVGGHSSPFHG